MCAPNISKSETSAGGKKQKQHSTMFGVLFKSTGVVLVALIAILLRLPQPEFKWEEDVLPMARRYVGVSVDEKVVENQLLLEKPLDGKIALVTGATNGIGLQVTRSLSKLGAKVIAHGRSQAKLDALKIELPSIEIAKADMSNLGDVSRMCDELVQNESIDRIDFLVNNAGIHQSYDLIKLMDQFNFSTPQGYDTVFATNYLSHFLLTEKLASLLDNSADPTIVQVSSTFHWGVDGSELVPTGPYENYSPMAALPGGGTTGFFPWRTQRSYCNSKLAQIYHARALQKRHPILSRARIASVCPGWVGTEIGGPKGSWTHFLFNLMAFPVEKWGIASTMTALLTKPSGPEDKADYYISTTSWGPMLDFFRKVQLPHMYGLRDSAILFTGFGIFFFIQRLGAAVHNAISSPDSFNEETTNKLYDWSMQAVSEYLS